MGATRLAKRPTHYALVTDVSNASTLLKRSALTCASVLTPEGRLNETGRPWPPRFAS